MDDNKDCVPLGKQVCVISTWLQVGAGGVMEKGFVVWICFDGSSEEEPSSCVCGWWRMTDDESSESERKVSFKFNIKNHRGVLRSPQSNLRASYHRATANAAVDCAPCCFIALLELERSAERSLSQLNRLLHLTNDDDVLPSCSTAPDIFYCATKWLLHCS